MGKQNSSIDQMASDALQCIKRGEHVEALEFYEEIDHRQGMRPEHLVAMGDCFLHTRQRQDARKAWIRAFEMSPGNQEVIDLLDKNFKGWEKTLSAKRQGSAHAESAPPAPPAPPAPDQTRLSMTVETSAPAGRDEAPPPPAPGGDETKLSLSFETVAPAERPARPARPEPPAPREESPSRAGTGRAAPSPRRQEPESEFEKTGSLRPASRPAAQPSAPAAHPVGAHANRPTAGTQLPPINWDFVMADAMAESGKGA